MTIVEKSTGFFHSFDGTPIYYELRGSGGRPVVFIYGVACLINHWHHQIHHFSRERRTLAFDLRGHHKSLPVHNPTSLTMESLAKDLLGLIQQLGVERPHVIGHSFGAPVIIEAYRQDPSAFQSLAFINGFAKNPIKGMFGLDVVEPFYHFVKNTYESNPDLWNTIWRLGVDNPLSVQLAGLAGGFNLKLTHLKDIEVYARGVAQMDLRIFMALFEEIMRFDGNSVLPTIDRPALVISGENDNVTPKKFQEEFRDLIPNSEFLLVPYGSHCTQLDFPDFVNLKLAEFWKKHD